MIEVNVRCGCSRSMRPDTFAGPGRYACGCGAKVALSGLPTFSAKRCPLPNGRRVCNGPKVEDDPLCQPHMVMVARLAVEDREIVKELTEGLARVNFHQEQTAERDRLREAERQRMEQVVDTLDARKVCVVYYCEIRPGIVKIGTTTNLAVRMGSFRVPASSVLAAEPGYFKLENLRHRQFPAQRIDPAREDFRLDDALRVHIDSVRDKHGDPYELVFRIRYLQTELAQDPNSELHSAKVG